MYLSKKQVHALEMALDAMDYRNSGDKDKEQEEAYDTICDMLRSSRKTIQKRKTKLAMKNQRSE